MIDDIARQVERVRIRAVRPRDPVHVEAYPENWRCVGVGTSAAVFQPKERSGLSVKVYAENRTEIAGEEAGIYEQLGESPYFPHYYGSGDNFLVISYRPGHNLYDCLVQGILIPEQVVRDVDDAVAYARGRGLNPADIHIKNIILHEGRGFLVDVSDYRKAVECKRWETLKQVYYDYYTEIYRPGMTVPSWVLETIRKWYKASEGEGDHGAFAERIIRMFF